MKKEWECKLSQINFIAGNDWQKAIKATILWVAYRTDNFTVEDVMQYFTGIPQWRVEEYMEINGWPIRHAA